ncbi:hypothetical protein AB0G02_28765, partial [Actinosynnema sp. NPDC023658]
MSRSGVGAARLVGALAVALLTACAPSVAEPASEPVVGSTTTTASSPVAPNSTTASKPPRPVPVVADR